MARKPLRHLIRSGGFYPSRKWTPLVYAGGYTTANGGEEPAPPPIEKTVTGNPIHILDALAKPAQALSVKLEPIQDLHGYDSPWPAGGGKNKCPTAWLTLGVPSDTSFGNTAKRTFTLGTYINGLTNNNYYFVRATDVTVAENSIKFTTSASAYGLSIPLVGLTVGQVYTISAVMTNALIGLSFYAEDGTYISGKMSTASNNYCSATVPSDTFFTLACFGGVTNDTESTFTDIQLEAGSTATSFAPYSNICPISGHTDADVTRTGKNLLNLNRTQGTPSPSGGEASVSPRVMATDKYYVGITRNNYYYPSNLTGVSVTESAIAFTATGGGYGIGMPMEVESGTAYTVSCVSSVNAKVAYGYYDAEWNYLSNSNNPMDFPNTVTPPTNTKYMLVVFVASTTGTQTTITKPQIELGSTASDYQPYAGTTYPIPLGTTVYGGTLDVVTGVLTVTMASVDLSTLGWNKVEQSGYKFFYAALSDGSQQDTSDCLCSIYATAHNALEFQSGDKVCRQYGSVSWNFSRIAVKDSDYDDKTKDEFQTAMSGVQLCYELATPQTIQLTPTQVELLQGENNLWSDGEMTLVYLADGNASDIEALNILLGGRYVNNHEADEPSDREALDIVLGGKK